MQVGDRLFVERVNSATTGACALTFVILISGCDSFPAQAEPTTPSEATAGSTAASSGATAATTPDAGPVAAADLAAAEGMGRPASLSVDIAPVTRGVPGLRTTQGVLSAVCQLPDDAVEYKTITMVFTDRGALGKQEPVSSNLRVDLTVVDGNGIGVFERSDVERASSPAGFCPGAVGPPAQTNLQTEELAGQYQEMTAYVLAPTDPAIPDPWRGAMLQLRDLRVNANDVNPRPWTWTVERVTAGSPCPDDPNSLCVPLG